MSALTLVNSVAGNAIIGSVATKLLDSFVTSNFSQKNEKKKWIREKKLTLFSELIDVVTSINCENLASNKLKIKNLISKTTLLLEDKNIKSSLKDYQFILEEYECFKNDINLDLINNELIEILTTHMTKM